MSPALEPKEKRERTEGPLNGHRVEFVREDQRGVTPQDPDWMLYSDVMRELWGWQPDASTEAQRGIEDVDAVNYVNGAEEHEVEFTYDAQRDPVAADGSPLGAIYDFMFRGECGNLASTHTVVDREDHCHGGATGAGFYVYTVGRGGYPEETENEADAGEAQPLPIGLTYNFVSVRQYIVYQPSAATSLVVSSDDDRDTTQTLTLEDEGANTTEEVTLNGTTAVATEGDFASLDALALSEDCYGDVTISVNDGDSSSPTAGQALTTIAGKRANSPDGDDKLRGDLGVPALGAGSRESEVQPEGQRTFVQHRGSRIERNVSGVSGAMAQVGPRINSATLTVSHNTDSSEDLQDQFMAIDGGVRDATLGANIAGPTAIARTTMDHLRGTGADILWYVWPGYTIRFPAATVTESGSLEPSSGDVSLYSDVSFGGLGIQLLEGDVVFEDPGPGQVLLENSTIVAGSDAPLPTGGN